MFQRLVCSALALSCCFACGSSNSSGGSAGSAGSAGVNMTGGGSSLAGGGSEIGTAGAAGTIGSSGGEAGAAGSGAAGAAGAVSGTAGAGAGTAGAGAGAGAGGTGGAVAADSGQSVTQRGGDSARTAHWVQSSFTRANAAKMAADTTFNSNATFVGQMSAVPLFVAGATPGTGLFIVATAGNKIYALNETTGMNVWTHNLGAPQGGKHDFTNAGEVSTPVIDLPSRTVYLAAGMATNRYELHALDVDTGNEKPNWPAVLSNVTSNTYTMSFADTNQRSALSLVNGIVYVAFGGYYGDAGPYHGWVVSVSATDPTKVQGWATQDARQAGIWASGGMASDGNGVFAITGNAAASDHTKSDSEEIIRITGMSVPNRDDNNLFYPDIWYTGMNSSDKDFGACSPAVINVPGSTPAKLVIAPAKPGHVYLLDAAKLGGSNGALSDVKVAGTAQESVYTAPTAYQSGTGVKLAISTSLGSLCLAPIGTTDGAVMGLAVQPGTATVKPALIIKWCAKIDPNEDTRRRSPVSTNSNAAGADPIVWFMNASKLNAYDGDTGAVLYDGGTDVCNANVRRFTAPIVANGRVIVGADGQLCSWSVH